MAYAQAEDMFLRHNRLLMTTTEPSGIASELSLCTVDISQSNATNWSSIAEDAVAQSISLHWRYSRSSMAVACVLKQETKASRPSESNCNSFCIPDRIRDEM